MTRSNKPIASLSLDLDNKWSYMKTHGDEGWQSYPSYLDIVVPRFLDALEQHGQKITVFIVGQDADIEANHKWLKQIASAGHEIGNHSYHHEPWLHLYSDEQIEQELSRAHACIENATGVTPQGFRGPGYSLSDSVLSVLHQMGYRYDASTFPTYIGPLARAYYFMTTTLSAEQHDERKRLFGTWRDGVQTLRPHWRQAGDGELIELPVSTMPIFKLPFHLSYLIFLSQYSVNLARVYFRWALTMCKLTRVEPSFLLHPLDFLGVEDGIGLDFFPGMQMKRTQKMALFNSVYSIMSARYHVVTTGEHASISRKLQSV